MTISIKSPVWAPCTDKDNYGYNGNNDNTNSDNNGVLCLLNQKP